MTLGESPRHSFPLARSLCRVAWGKGRMQCRCVEFLDCLSCPLRPKGWLLRVVLHPGERRIRLFASDSGSESNMLYHHDYHEAMVGIRSAEIAQTCM